MKIEKLKPGMTVYDVGQQRMGNTTLSSVAVWNVEINEVHLDTRTVTASWNGNTPKKFTERTWSKWRLNRPMLITSGFGRTRLATRVEIAAARKKS